MKNEHTEVIHINDALKALKEASVSTACALDEPTDVTVKDLEHIQNQITVLEKFLNPLFADGDLAYILGLKK